ncbi:hypothetical protein [Luteolibacter marinus]|uniref:hypothetical protein n=1 Tax=Luteolibacter marinus TaxID=2776705 RepID=UPI001868708F|nr:hypothetical protein [Luteolibacter marinus]
MTISRRSWIHLAFATLCGCKGRKTAGPTRTPPNDAAPRLLAGPFEIDLPPGWRASASIEKVPAHALYTPDQFKWLQQAEAEGDPSPPLLKPHFGVRPQHWAIRLPAAIPPGFTLSQMDAGDNPTAPQILIHKAREWASIFRDGTEGLRDSTAVIQSMRQKLDATIRGEGVDPCPAVMDGSLTFDCLKKRLDFEGGYGIRMIAQRTIEPQMIRKGQLHYLFVGISDDNTCQVLATFPVTLPGLPGEDSLEHLGQRFEPYHEFVQDYDSYQGDAITWLEQHATEIDPSLDKLDKMLENLVVRQWE